MGKGERESGRDKVAEGDMLNAMLPEGEGLSVPSKVLSGVLEEDEEGDLEGKGDWDEDVESAGEREVEEERD